MKSGLPIFPFLIVLKILFFLVRLAYMITSTGVWYRLTFNLPLDCPSLQLT